MLRELKFEELEQVSGGNQYPIDDPLYNSNDGGTAWNIGTDGDWADMWSGWASASSNAEFAAAAFNASHSNAITRSSDETYDVGGGSSPIPFDSSLAGDPDGGYRTFTGHNITLGNNQITVGYYGDNGINPLGSSQADRVDLAITYLDQVFGSLNSSNQADLSHLNGIVISDNTDPSVRSGINLQTGVFTLTLSDLVGDASRGGYSTLDLADRIAHDAHHETQFLNHEYDGANLTTNDGLTIAMQNERDAINAELNVGRQLSQLSVASNNGAYSYNLRDLNGYVDESDPTYMAHQYTLIGRLLQPFGGQ